MANMIISCIKAVAEAITGFNECVSFSQWVRSLGSHSNETEKQEHKEDVLKLQSSFQCLRDTLPEMYNFINRVEWRSHEKGVAELLPELKAAVYDAEDLLEDFQCYEQKVKIEGSAASAELDTKFFQDFNTKLTVIKNRLDNPSMMLERMGLHQATLRFDRSVRPETTSFPTDAKIFGRDEEIKRLIQLLGVPANNSRGPSTRKRPRSDNTLATITSVPVLPIVGIGGVGKTTLAQNICSHPQVKKHFDVIAWICVSDDLDVKRLTKEAIEQFSRKAPTKDNLNSLQADLAYSLNKRRFLIVLDDIWDDNAERWRTFYAPFKLILEGSMMLVTTRFQKVADIVHTTTPFLLEGLKDNVFRNFFKLCVFGSNSSNNDPELERIGEQILPKLKGSPLAAKTLGRLLGRSLDPEHWNTILYSQLWELRQEETDILPALRLSYMYLPFHLKRCFSFCAVYPKDYNFVKEDLAEIWVAEGYVKPQCNISLQQTGCEYFEELAHLSFFQKLRGKYVIHDLIHDMAQLVSKDECFIIKEKKDLERIPQNVRHLSVLRSRDFKCPDLKNLCKQTKLRTLLCYMSLDSRAGSNMMEEWCTELLCMRVMVWSTVKWYSFPDRISNMKNLRYLKILNSATFHRLPAAFCHLYNLQLFCARKCIFEEAIPRGCGNLINLQKFGSKFLKIDAAMENGEGIRLLNNVNIIVGKLYISNICEIGKDQAAEIALALVNKAYTSDLTLNWSKEKSHLLGPPKHNEIEVFEALRPPTNIKSVCLICYPGEYLPSWFHGSDDPTIFSLLCVEDCPLLSSLEQFLHPAYMPAIQRLLIIDCPSLEYVLAERFLDLPSLELLTVMGCPKINSHRLQAPSLKTIHLVDSGNFGEDIHCTSVTCFVLERSQLETLNVSLPSLKYFTIRLCPRLKWQNNATVLPSSLLNLHLDDCGELSSWFPRCLENLKSLKSLEMINCKGMLSIPAYLWSSNLKSLRRLKFWTCEDLVSIGGPEAIAHIPKVDIYDCPKLKEVQQPLYW